MQSYLYLEQGHKKLLVTEKAMIGTCKARDMKNRSFFQFTNDRNLALADYLELDWVM